MIISHITVIVDSKEYLLQIDIISVQGRIPSRINGILQMAEK